MSDLAEVALAKAKKRSPINFRIAANVIVQRGSKRISGRVCPGLLGLIGRIDENGLRIPIPLAAWQVAPSFQEQNTLAGWSQPVRQRRTTGSGTNDNDVEMIRAQP